MRVRYGKPIKVISLLNSFNALGTSDGSTHMVARKEGYFKHDASVNNLRKFSIVNGHKYFLCAKTEFALDSFVIMSGTTWYQPLFTSPTPTYTNGNSYSIIDNVNADNNNVGLLIWCNNAPIDDWKVYNCIIIDLTEIGLDNLTAQEFYTKYNKYFSLIATGEEITIDNKAGQVKLFSGLPSDYQRVEYIESTGTQYIDTNFKPNQDTRLIVDALVTQFNTNANTCIGSGREAYNLNNFGIMIGGAGSGYTYNILYYGYGNQNIQTSTLLEANTKYKFELNKNKGYLNNNLITTISDATFISPYNLYLFACNQTASNKFIGYIRVYASKIYDDDTLIRDFIPCYRKSDNVIGLYDLIGKQFYTNQGTGTFLKGNNVNNTTSCKVAGGSSDIYYGYNQLFNCVKTSNGGGTISFDNNGIYTYTFGSSVSSNAYTNVVVDETTSLIIGHKYALLRSVYAPHDGAFYCRYQGHSQSFNVTANTWTTDDIILTASNSGSVSSYIGPTNPSQQNYTENDVYKVRHQVIDLTWWYGPGKEPTTVQEFKEKFTKDYYGFCSTPIKLTRYQIEALPSYNYNQLCPPFTSSYWYANGSYRKFNTTDNSTSVVLNGSGNNEQKGRCLGNSSNTKFTITSGHKYFCSFKLKLSMNATNFPIDFQAYPRHHFINTRVNLEANTYKTLETITTSSVTANDVYPVVPWLISTSDYNGATLTFKDVIIVDLTNWYGAGNEPVTVEEFKATFPNKYYLYSKKRLLNKYIINKLIN